MWRKRAWCPNVRPMRYVEHIDFPYTVHSLSVMHARIAALALALLVAVGCDSDDDAPAAGSCQAHAAELVEIEECQAGLGLRDVEPNVDVSARCAAEALGLDDPPEGVVEGEAYQVTYKALCDLHGNTAADYCEISRQLGCEG